MSRAKKSDSSQDKVTIDRRGSSERRAGDRRKESVPIATERRQAPRRKVQRRRQIDPTTCERDYTNDEIQFMQALDDYKRSSGRMFPTCSEILEVVRKVGYVKVVDPETLDQPLETTTGIQDETEGESTDVADNATLIIE